MASKKGSVTEKALAVVTQGDAPLRASKLPPHIRFPLLVVLNLTLSSLVYSFIADTAGDLARVSRSLDEWWEVGALLAYRTFELGLGWFGEYDSYDLAALSLLSHGPPLYLLGTFYDVRPVTVISSLIIDALTTYIPFRLLRPLSPAHAASTSSRSVAVPNREILTDFSIQAYTTLLAAAIYSVALYGAYSSYLPVYLVTYFNDIPSIVAAHSATPVTLFPMTLLLGMAAKSFIFTPATAISTSLADAKASAFNPATATLGETFQYYLSWLNSHSRRTQVVLKRTATLILVSGINTFVQTFVTVEGVEVRGAAAYSAVWAAAAGTTGLALGVVGAV